MKILAMILVVTTLSWSAPVPAGPKSADRIEADNAAAARSVQLYGRNVNSGYYDYQSGRYAGYDGYVAAPYQNFSDAMSFSTMRNPGVAYASNASTQPGIPKLDVGEAFTGQGKLWKNFFHSLGEGLLGSVNVLINFYIQRIVGGLVLGPTQTLTNMAMRTSMPPQRTVPTVDPRASCAGCTAPFAQNPNNLSNVLNRN